MARRRTSARKKIAHLKGSPRVGSAEVAELIALAASDDAGDRLHAASFLCPCHVRRWIAPAWAAVYRLLEDDDGRVRRQAWHTLEDGGRPDDPALDAIIERTLARETDAALRRKAEALHRSRHARTMTYLHAAARPAPVVRGRCDFCGDDDVPIAADYGTLIPTEGFGRPARVCESCAAAEAMGVVNAPASGSALPSSFRHR